MTANVEIPFWRRRSWLTQTGHSSVAIYAAALIGFVTNVLVARALGAVNFGDMVLAVTVVVSIAALLDFSLEEAVVHHGAKLIATGARGSVSSLLRMSMRLDVAVGAGVVTLIWIAAPTLARVVSSGRLSSVLLVLASLEVLATTVNGTTGATLMLAGRPDLRAWALAWTSVLKLAAVMLAIHWLGGGAQKVLVGYALGAGVGSGIQYLVARSTATSRWGASPQPSPVRMRELVLFGFHSSATTTIIAARAALVTVVVGRDLGPVEVGLLSIALLPVTLADVFTAPVRTTAYTEQATLAAEGRLDVLGRAIKAYTLVAIGVGLVAAAVGWFLLPWLLPWLYGPSFDAAVPASRLLLPAAIATLAVAWGKSLPATFGRPEIRTKVSAIELGATAIMVLALVGGGVEGVAAALSVVAVATACLWVAIARRMLADEDRRAPANAVAGIGGEGGGR